MEVNRMRHVATIDQREMDRLALAHADHGSRHGAIEGPGMVGNIRRDRDQHEAKGETPSVQLANTTHGESKHRQYQGEHATSNEDPARAYTVCQHTANRVS